MSLSVFLSVTYVYLYVLYIHTSDPTFFKGGGVDFIIKWSGSMVLVWFFLKKEADTFSE